MDSLFDLDSVIDEYCAMSDEELAVRARSDKGAANALVLRYSRTAYFKAKALADGRCDPDDLCQEGLIGLLKAIAGFDTERGFRFSTFAETCIVNQVKDYLSKTWLRGADSQEILDEDMALSVTDENTPESIFLRKEFFEEVWGTVSTQLSGTEQQVFRLCVSGMSYREASEKLGMTEKSVDNAMQRARRKLRALIGRSGN